ncbi:hypothetical protein A2115_03305 [Candidatus Woesebacteria bacterium GWA1_41_8]|uniref:HD domain-containing protein n=1 Tax=Candidatus Woesebacteria bacterium GWA1_41_8 TaxID=1802471 RepID=A0A1F7WHU8_9BACT|nr:MAG: hypothetical protein A2115_03305 [Candidatus Woesebacteria bacterium GWA1_41_8]
MEEDFKKLLSDIQSYTTKSEDVDDVKKAWDFAKIAHFDVKRKNGESYLVHCLETAKELVDWKLDRDSIVAGILHDTVDHGAATYDDLEENFGKVIADLVEGVTNVSFVKLKKDREEWYVENLRKMFLAMARDLRVVIIKIASRIHNMKTLEPLSDDRKKHAAEETLEIYAPLAERLGMSEVKGKLEDLSFACLYPEDYLRLSKEVNKAYKKSDLIMKQMRKELLNKFSKEGVNAKLQSRKKNLYSLWRKLQRPEIAGNLFLVHDIVAMRILVDTEEKCYATLGILHHLYKPVPNTGVSDYIAQPKPNGYRSIHTKVVGPGNKFVEVQIRTYQMHQEDEYGVAAHWYLSNLKNQGRVSSKDIDEGTKITVDTKKLYWVKQLADWQKEIKDSKEFLEAVKFDALSERIFVFSPKGDVYDLPLGATPVDYAFNVHTGLGFYIKDAKVNGKIVPLDYKLKSGDVVKIEKTKNIKKPNRDWLGFIKSTVARREIGKHFRNAQNSG